MKATRFNPNVIETKRNKSRTRTLQKETDIKEMSSE
jgi:hypothetical protein